MHPFASLAYLTANNVSTNLIINLVILVLVLVVAFWIVAKMAAPEPIGTILRVVIGLLGLLWLLNLIGFVGGHPFFIYHQPH